MGDVQDGQRRAETAASSQGHLRSYVDEIQQ
jgi:hypothetical protein